MKAKRFDGFTLVELLTVISLIAILAALLFPVFAQVRGSARKVVCASNLRQLGMAVAVYAQDYDEHYPIGSDSVDRYLYEWHIDPELRPLVETMPLLRDILNPYIKSRNIWRCPSDIGSKSQTFYDSTGVALQVPLDPTAYDRLGTSYVYRGVLGLQKVLYPGDCALGDPPDIRLRGAAQSAVLMDAAPNWHGEATNGTDTYRYNILFADGHVKIQNDLYFLLSWWCDPQ